MTAPDPLVSAWEARPADPDGTVEKMARAMYEEAARDLPNAVPWEEIHDASKQTYRRLAIAALQVVKAPAGDPHTAAIRRIEALADELERETADSNWLLAVGERSGLLMAVSRLRALSGGAR